MEHSHTHPHEHAHAHVHPCRDDKKVAAIRARLARVEGQVRGISRMVEDDEDCVQVIIQINAARAALQKVAQNVLHGHLKHCIVDGIKNGDEDAVMSELIDAIEQYSKM